MSQPDSGCSISATVPDWSRETKPPFSWMPGISLLRSVRLYGRLREYRAPVAYGMRVLAVLRHRFWSAVTGTDIPIGTQIGGGLLMPHPNGIVIHPDVIIGPNCLIFQQVTLGWGNGGVPRIGGHVDIGAGAKILGQVTVGDHARIGANAVVLQDVPPYATAVGIPARILQIGDDRTRLRSGD
jgi:serine O-acetyltransferase